MYHTMNDFSGRKTNDLNNKNHMILDSPSPKESLLTPANKKQVLDFKQGGSQETFENLTTAGPSAEPGANTQRQI